MAAAGERCQERNMRKTKIASISPNGFIYVNLAKFSDMIQNDIPFEN
jgi:hypothetical protein